MSIDGTHELYMEESKEDECKEIISIIRRLKKTEDTQGALNYYNTTHDHIANIIGTIRKILHYHIDGQVRPLTPESLQNCLANKQSEGKQE